MLFQAGKKIKGAKTLQMSLYHYHASIYFNPTSNVCLNRFLEHLLMNIIYYKVLL